MYLTRFFVLLGALLLLAVNMVSAQIKVRRPAEIWPDLQSDYNLDNNSFFFFRNEYRHTTDQSFNTLSEDSPWNNFNRIQVQLGYENSFTGKWSGGASGRYAFEEGDIFFSEFFLRHTGSIGEQFRFMKRGTFEHLSNEGNPNEGRFRLLLELDKIIELAQERVIRPRVSYEFFKNTTFGRGDDDPEGRNIDRTRLRFDLNFELNRYLFFSPYFTRQTDYYVLEPQFDGNGNLSKPGGKHNFITPIFGMGIRFNFYQSLEAVSSRHR
ncbi:hypothetical protein BH24BAC1_BH24BAC1_22040 [soil metagenome]